MDPRINQGHTSEDQEEERDLFAKYFQNNIVGRGEERNYHQDNTGDRGRGRGHHQPYFVNSIGGGVGVDPQPYFRSTIIRVGEGEGGDGRQPYFVNNIGGEAQIYQTTVKQGGVLILNDPGEEGGGPQRPYFENNIEGGGGGGGASGSDGVRIYKTTVKSGEIGFLNKPDN